MYEMISFPYEKDFIALLNLIYLKIKNLEQLEERKVIIKSPSIIDNNYCIIIIHDAMEDILIEEIIASTKRELGIMINEEKKVIDNIDTQELRSR